MIITLVVPQQHSASHAAVSLTFRTTPPLFSLLVQLPPFQDCHLSVMLVANVLLFLLCICKSATPICSAVSPSCPRAGVPHEHDLEHGEHPC